MIVNKQHNFIFIHVPRTGGKSVREMWGRNAHKQHMTYEETTKTFKELNFNEYFTFGFIRNPWERVYSLFCKHVSDGVASKGFKYWMFDESRTDSKRHKQSAIYFLQGVDYIARFEDFEQEWDYIFDKIGLTRVKLPHINERRGGKPYQFEYDDEMKDFIYNHHQDDIDYGSYTYD